jgi:signal transduction histidine kinase
MRTRLFRSFLLVIGIALLSSVVFQRLMVRDFDRYVESVREDQFRWVLASVESSYMGEGWDLRTLTESLHWATMLGMDARVLAADGREILNSREAMRSLSGDMLSHMAHLFHLEPLDTPFSEHPLIVQDRRVGRLLYRPLPKKEIVEREQAFKEKTEYFLYISLAIAGGGGLFLALLLSQVLSKPLLRMREAAIRIARGDLHARIRHPRPASAGSDEVASLAESFNFMAESLQREETMRANLLSNISHELRTPLTVIKAHIEALEDGMLEGSAAMKTIKTESERLIELVRGIEDLTLAEAEFLKPGKPRPVHLREFFDRLIEGQLPVAREKDLRLELVQEKELVVAADVDKLEKIVRNLLSNAIKFTGPGGRIHVDYGRNGETFFFEVSDTGIGIAEDQLSHVFDRFYQVERAGSSGLGLGLAIVKEAIDALGGRIDVKSVTGEGTVFKVHLPLHPPPK